MNSKAVRTVLWGAGAAVMTLVSFVAAQDASAQERSGTASLRGEDLMIASPGGRLDPTACGGWLEPRCPTTNVTAVRG